MARGYSDDLRVRVIQHVEAGASRREAARLFKIGDATAVRWFQRWSETGTASAKPSTGHARSPLKAHEAWLLELIAATPDLTLEEIRQALFDVHGQKAGIGCMDNPHSSCPCSKGDGFGDKSIRGKGRGVRASTSEGG